MSYGDFRICRLRDEGETLDGDLRACAGAARRWLDDHSDFDNTDKLIRYGVAEALQNIHTALAVTYLAPLLDSNDPQFRALAIDGIACFANALPIIDPNGKDGGFDLATVGPFKTEDTLQHFAFGSMTISKRESYYLTYWREWWLNNAANVESKLNG